MTEVQAVTKEQEMPGPDSNDNVHTDTMELVGDADDRSSSLSDIEDRAMADVNEKHLDEDSGKSEDDDTEAETERLEASPQKARKQKMITLKPMQAEPIKNTISIEQQEVAEEGWYFLIIVQATRNPCMRINWSRTHFQHLIPWRFGHELQSSLSSNLLTKETQKINPRISRKRRRRDYCLFE